MSQADDREERVKDAEERLLELESRGVTLDDILNGPEGHMWIEGACGGDRELAMEAFQRVHPGARFFGFADEE